MTAPARPALTERELDVLTRMANGDTYASIASAYGIGLRTACWIGQRVMQKLGARNISHAVLLACHAGLLDGRPQQHGDHNGYEAHVRRRDEICDLCRAGERAYRAALKAAKGVAA